MAVIIFKLHPYGGHVFMCKTKLYFTQCLRQKPRTNENNSIKTIPGMSGNDHYSYVSSNKILALSSQHQFNAVARYIKLFFRESETHSFNESESKQYTCMRKSNTSNYKINWLPEVGFPVLAKDDALLWTESGLYRLVTPDWMWIMKSHPVN